MAIIDWMILAAYFAGLIAIGIYISKRQSSVNDYFLGGRNMPTWAVSMSIVATSLSAGTFIGLPQITYEKDFTYLMLSLGSTIGGIAAAFIILPAIYRAKTVTVYGFLEKRYGEDVVLMSSIVFLLGQLLAAGARLFIAAIAVSIMLFNTIQLPFLITAIAVLGAISTVYTALGGIKAVILIDCVQIVIVATAGLIIIGLLLHAIPLSIPEVWGTLSEAGKLTLVSTDSSLSNPYSLWSALFAFGIFSLAQYGVDHDFAQRMLTCKSTGRAIGSMVASRFLSIPVVLLFLVIGALLYIYYGRPDIMGDFGPTETIEDTRKIFPHYLFNHLPPGLVGITIAGLFAAALSSFDSSTNAMASSFVSDIYLPWKKRKKGADKETTAHAEELKESRITVLITGTVLTLFAILAALMQQAGGQRLVDFALGVMGFAYSGLLGVFVTAIFTKRGNQKSILAALIAGPLVVLSLQPFLVKYWSPLIFGEVLDIAWPWWMVFGSVVSFVVCYSGKFKGKQT